ncbi:hypothetical protein SAMN04487897_1424 [Paenibacillus sp. yr247]|nr:hypothetical protein SAMN04487897_1424 [Paenibacillus sp. yr247]
MSASKERLLKWYDFHESPSPMVPSGIAFATPSLFSQEVRIPGSITLKHINSNDRIELKATIVWDFSLTSLAGPLVILATQKMQFSIWRDAPFTGKRLCTVLDSGSLTEIISAVSLPTFFSNTITTSFAYADKHVKGETHKFYLTAVAGGASGFQVFIGEGGGTPRSTLSKLQPLPRFILMAPLLTRTRLNSSLCISNNIQKENEHEQRTITQVV